MPGYGTSDTIAVLNEQLRVARLEMDRLQKLVGFEFTDTELDWLWSLSHSPDGRVTRGARRDTEAWFYCMGTAESLAKTTRRRGASPVELLCAGWQCCEADNGL